MNTQPETQESEEVVKQQDIDDDFNEPLGTPACSLDGECESCQ